MIDREKAIQFLYRMVINVVSGHKERNEELYQSCLQTLRGCDNIQYLYYEPLITIGEYIKAMQPEIFTTLKGSTYSPKLRDVTSAVLQAADIPIKSKEYVRLMQERPLPGRAGLLPGEKEEALL